MEKFLRFVFAALLAGALFSCQDYEPYDDSGINSELDRLEESINDLLASTNALEEDVEALRQIVDALSKNLHIVSVAETGETTVINLSDGSSITINHPSEAETPEIPEALFKEAYVDGEVFVVVLADGTEIRLPMYEELQFVIDASSVDGVEAGKTVSVSIDTKGVDDFSVVKPVGWTVAVSGNEVSVTAPQEGLDYAEYGGTIDFIAVGHGESVIAKLPVYAYVYRPGTEEIALDFEGDYYYVRLAEAGDNYGNCFYNVPEDDQWQGMNFVSDENFDVFFGTNLSYGSYQMYNGSLLVSYSNNMEQGDFNNQLSVYFSDPVTGMGGHGGSKHFGVNFSVVGGYGEPTRINFATPRKLLRMYVANSTYAYLLMRDGNPFGTGKPFGYETRDWFKIVAYALDENMERVGSAEFYLADFRTPDAPGLLEGWHEFDLSVLPECQFVEFDMQGSDMGDYGLNTPAYFCFDDLVYEAEGETVKIRL